MDPVWVFADVEVPDDQENVPWLGRFKEWVWELQPPADTWGEPTDPSAGVPCDKLWADIKFDGTGGGGAGAEWPGDCMIMRTAQASPVMAPSHNSRTCSNRHSSILFTVQVCSWRGHPAVTVQEMMARKPSEKRMKKAQQEIEAQLAQGNPPPEGPPRPPRPPPRPPAPPAIPDKDAPGDKACPRVDCTRRHAPTRAMVDQNTTGLNAAGGHGWGTRCAWLEAAAAWHCGPDQGCWH